MSCSSCNVLFLRPSNLLEKLHGESVLIRIWVVIILTAIIGNLMLSSGSIGVTLLSASATGMSLPFLYTTLNGRYGKDLDYKSLNSWTYVNHMLLVYTHKWLLVSFQWEFLSIQEVVDFSIPHMVPSASLSKFW